MAKGRTPRNFSQRYAKWVAKFTAFSNPTVANTILSSVSPIAQQNAQLHMAPYGDLNSRVASILNQYGVTGPDRAKYQGFAMKLQRILIRTGGGASFFNQANGVKSYYVTAFNANPAILDALINVVAGETSLYIS